MRIVRIYGGYCAIHLLQSAKLLWRRSKRWGHRLTKRKRQNDFLHEPLPGASAEGFSEDTGEGLIGPFGEVEAVGVLDDLAVFEGEGGVDGVEDGISLDQGIVRVPMALDGAVGLGFDIAIRDFENVVAGDQLPHGAEFIAFEMGEGGIREGRIGMIEGHDLVEIAGLHGLVEFLDGVEVALLGGDGRGGLCGLCGLLG